MRNRLILLFVVLAVASVGYFGGFFQYLAPDRMHTILTEAGPWGPAVVITMFILLEPFGAPGAIFLVAAATIWPFWTAIAISWVGAVGAGMFGFAFARYLGRDWVEDHMPERMRAWDERLSQEGLPITIAFRALFFLNPASHWALGLSRVPVPTAVVGTAIGFAPWVVMWTYFGAAIFEWFNAQSAGLWLALAVLVVAIVAFRKYRGRAAVVVDAS